MNKCQKLFASPQTMVIKLQIAMPAVMMSLRFFRSTRRATGNPRTA